MLITVMFAAVLAFTLLIERAIEVLKAGYDLLDSYLDFAKFWTRKTRQTGAYMEKQLRKFEFVDAKRSAAIFNRFHDLLLGPSAGYNGTVPMLCGDLMRAVYVKIGSKVVGTAIGVIIAFSLDFDLLAAAQGQPFTALVPTFKGMLLTGIAMGLGTGPMHKLIRVVEKKRESRLPQVVTNA
jgi:hypothetical protein